MADPSISRRRFVALGAAASMAALAGMPGCSSSGGSGSGSYDEAGEEGFSVDCVNPAGAEVSLRACLDQSVLPMVDAVGWDEYVSRYCSCGGRENVKIDYDCFSPDKIAAMASTGAAGYDLLIGSDEVVQAGVEAGVLYGGAGNTSVRSKFSIMMSFMRVYHRKGANVLLPEADTVDGNDYPDGRLSRMMNLAKFDGKLAVASDSTLEGRAANQVLQQAGLYSSENGAGGEYDKSLRDIVVVVDDYEAVAKAVAEGRCELGMMLDWQARQSSGLAAEYYEPPQYPKNNGLYAGASIVGSEHDGVARDFLQFLVQQQ